jgi:putative phosphoserine phosphatase / 1-acylglycerol-3-phosphate O-acyltransferase
MALAETDSFGDVHTLNETTLIISPTPPALAFETYCLIRTIFMNIIAALFDMDHTITWENSGLSFVKYARKKGMVNTGHLLRSMFKIILYRMSFLNIEHWYEKNMEILAGTSLKEMESFCSSWFEVTLKRAIYREARQLVGDHKQKGHRVAIISNSPIFFVKPMAELLEIQDVICTQVEVNDGVLTGKIIKPLCYGEGKRMYAQEWSSGNGVNLSQSYFYTDSYFDIALLKIVGHPIATNPDMRLRKAAISCNWPIREFVRESAF